jgi:hypothetical protein
MDNLIKIEAENVEDIEKEILELVREIPFENSRAQERSLIDNSLVPEHAFKNIGLRLTKKLEVLKICGIHREQKENKIKLLNYQLEDLYKKYPNEQKLRLIHRERIELKIREIRAGFPFEDKLAEDVKAELSYLYTTIKKLPRYTREQFEEGDKLWLAMKLNSVSEGIGELSTKGLAEAIERESTSSSQQIFNDYISSRKSSLAITLMSQDLTQ